MLITQFFIYSLSVKSGKYYPKFWENFEKEQYLKKLIITYSFVNSRNLKKGVNKKIFEHGLEMKVVYHTVLKL